MIFLTLVASALAVKASCWENYAAQCFPRTISCYLGSCNASGDTYNAVRSIPNNTGIANTGDSLTSGWSVCHYECVVVWGIFTCTATEDVEVGVLIATGTVC